MSWTTFVVAALISHLSRPVLLSDCIFTLIW